MRNRYFFLWIVGIFLLISGIFLGAHPSAAASAGLSLGFSTPLAHPGLFFMVIVMGGVTSFLPREGIMLMPIGFTLMTMMGGLMMQDVSQLPVLRYFVLCAILCMGLLITTARERYTVFILLILASLGYHLGGFYMSIVPSIASPMHYLMGVLLCLGMGLLISIAFGMTIFGEREVARKRLLRWQPLIALQQWIDKE